MGRKNISLMDTSSGTILRRSVVAIIVLVVASIGFMQANTMNESTSTYDAIFNFGDSNYDAGGFLAINGMTFFNKTAGRYSDGRLIIDFLAEGLGLPFLSPYIRSIGSDYKHGANFATASATILDPKLSSRFSPISLQVQLNQMKMFKQHVEHYQGRNNLPKGDVFGKSLYTINIGQNDLVAKFLTTGVNGAREIHPKMISQIITTVKELYEIGGRAFMVFNLAPYGCFPAYLVTLPHDGSDIDEFGCMKSYNNVVVEYNNMLKRALNQTRQQFSDAKLIYVDIHTLFLQLFHLPASHGLKYSTRACCGFGGGKYNFDPRVICGETKVINGENVKAEACSDAYNYVSWDGLYVTETANKLMTTAILKLQMGTLPQKKKYLVGDIY